MKQEKDKIEAIEQVIWNWLQSHYQESCYTTELGKFTDALCDFWKIYNDNKDEIEQLKTNAEILARGVRDLNHENYELTQKLAKQARIARDANAKCTGIERYLRPFQYKADRLETKCNDLKKLSDWQRKEIKKLDQQVKQAKIDTINTIVKYCENQDHWNELKDCKLWGRKSDDLRDFLNSIFKENEEQ